MKRIFLLGASFGAIILSSIVYAAPQHSLKQEFEKAFQAVLQNPADINTTLHYAKLAVELKDYEAAIPAYERILLFNPKLYEIKCELGVLYYQLQSYDMAKLYLHEVVSEKKASVALRERASTYLQKIETQG